MTNDNVKITTTKQRKEMAKKKKIAPLINYSILATFGFPGNSVVKKKIIIIICLPMQVRSLSREDPMEKEMVTHSSILP